MTRIISAAYAAFLLLGASLASAAEPAPAPAPLDGLLAAISATGATNGATSLAGLSALPEEVLFALAGQIVPMATNGDAAARTAMCELSYHAGRPGQAAFRAKYGRVLLRALEALGDPEVKAFFVEQLRIVRLDGSLPALAARLPDPALRDPAARALAALGNDAARDALLAALAKADAAAAPSLLDALSWFPGVKPAALLPWAANTNREIRLLALHALAVTADPAARAAFAPALAAEADYERGQALAFYTQLGQNLLAKGDTGAAAEIGRELMKSGETRGDVQTTCAGLAALVAAAGRKAEPELIAALRQDSRVLCAQAIRLARTLKSPAIDAALAAKLGAGPADARIDALDALADRGELSLKAVRPLLRDADAAVRIAAAAAELRCFADEAAADLPPLLAGPDADAVRALLGGLPEKNLPALAAALPGAAPEAQAQLLALLGARRMASAWAAADALAAGTNEAVAKAAAKAIGPMTDAAHVPKLLDRFLAAADAQTLEWGRALAAAAADPAAAEQELAADGKVAGKKRLAWHGVLQRMGGEKAKAILTADAASTDVAIQESAKRALAQLEKPAPAKAAKPNAKKAAARAKGAKAAPPAGNLSQGRPVKATVRAQGRQAPELAVDGDESLESSWWGAAWPADLTVDLGAAQEVEAARVVFYYADGRYYQYALSLSADGTKWTEVADRRTNTVPVSEEGVLLKFAPQKARYAKLTVTKNSANEAVHLVEFQVFAAGKAPATALAAVAVPPPPPELAPADAEGYHPLFNGKNLDGWVGAVKGYGASNGVMFCDPKVGGNLFTAQEFADFSFKFEFKLPPGANNGVGIRSPMQGDSAYGAMEIQIIDDTAPQFAKLQEYQYHGSIYGVVAAKRGHQKPIGEWNEEEIRAVGSKITVILNGTTIVDADLAGITETADHKAHPGLHRPSGHIGWLGHGARVEFRNIRPKPLGGPVAAAATSSATSSASAHASASADEVSPPPAPPAGFTALFNGKDLSGWKGLWANPIVRAKATPEDAKVKQAAADQRMRDHWRVENGALVFDGKGDALCTAKDYGDFEMYVDWKIGPGGDSGIYLRGSPQVQIWDPEKHPVGSGGLYNNQKNPANPLVCADRPTGQWNTFFIRMVGEKVTVKFNDKLVVDNVTMENYWDRKQPIFPTGQIELQNHGSTLYFRNVYLRELPK